MPRVRWAEPCRAHRTDGEPCAKWAVRGAFVCDTHGGSLARTRHAATVRLCEMAIRRGFERARAKWERQYIAFHAERIRVTAELMDLPIEQVTEFDIWECRRMFGVPAPSWEEPKLRDVPLDGRTKRFLRSLAGERR